MRLWRDPGKVKFTPVVSRLAFFAASAGQIERMLRERTSAGQSIFSWAITIGALLLWVNFYRVCTPEQRVARWVSWFSVIEAAAVLGVVIYFRFRL